MYIVKEFPERSIIAYPFANNYSSLGRHFFVSHFTRESNRRFHDQYTATTIETYLYVNEQLHRARKWQFAAFPYIKEVRKATELRNKNCSFNSALSTPAVSTSAFRSTNLFLFNTNSVAPFSACKPIHKPITPQIALTKGSRSKSQLLNYLWWTIYVINSVEFAKSPCNYHTESTYAVQYWGPILIQVRL